MGIKHLWSILTPIGERKPLYELQGKTVAIDLSCWVCEAQNVSDYYTQPKMYLRNLYFRTCYLLLMQVTPVFVLEGKAPELKRDTIAARNALQFKGAKPKSDNSKIKCKDRSRFDIVLRSCEEMLRYMGLACVKGKGEAESLCAYLNEDGLVDGVISQDSDCFAYGARIVYRNFSISQQGAQSGGGSIDVYDISKVQDALHLGRNKMIAMAVLCGSDYNNGVFGVGKEAAVKLFEHVSDDDILDRLRSWRTNAELFERFHKELTNKNICTSCGHCGKLQVHVKNGCSDCASTKGCDFSTYKNRRLQIKNEVAMRAKALTDPEFPNEQLIEEFLVRSENVARPVLKWQQPNLVNFVNFAVKQLQWECVYAFEKFLPIITRWQLTINTYTVLTPKCIKKTRNLKGVPSYELVWADSHGLFVPLLDASQDVDLEQLWSTVEPQHLVDTAYPNLVEAFRTSKAKPKASKRVRKPKTTVDCLEKMLANTSLQESKPKRKAKTIDSYFKRAVLKNLEAAKNDSFNLDVSKFGDESDMDLSDIVDDIVSRNLNLYTDLDTSSFFISEINEDDLFKKSMDLNTELSSSSDEDEDSFYIESVPLIDRVKCK